MSESLRSHWSPPGSSVHGIFQARILEQVAISSSRGSSQPRDQTLISCVSCTGRWILYHWVTWEALTLVKSVLAVWPQWNMFKQWTGSQKKVKTLRPEPMFNNLGEKKKMEWWTEKCSGEKVGREWEGSLRQGLKLLCGRQSQLRSMLWLTDQSWQKETPSLLRDNTDEKGMVIGYTGFPGDDSGKEPACQCRRRQRCRFNPWVRKIPWRSAWQPTPVSLPGEFQGQRSLVGYSPYYRTESDMTEATQHTACIWYRK